jgi:Flp pilus assembly secretin CpaC
LVAELMDEKKIEAAYARIQELLAKGTAQLLAWPIVTTHSGQRALVEAIDEIRYATEFDPPTVSFTPSFNAAETLKIEPKADVTLFEAIPTTFETRNVGVTLEVEPVVSADGKTIKLDLVPQHVRLKGYHKVTVEKPSTGGKVVVEQPEFDVLKVTTSLTLKNGQRVLMGVFRVAEPPKHLEMFLLKAEAEKVE